jgi:predicted O-methyltransferase YrrM
MIPRLGLFENWHKMIAPLLPCSLAPLLPCSLASQPELFLNESSIVLAERIGRVHPAFSKTVPYKGAYINSAHALYSQCPEVGEKIDVGINGSLRKEDALKLYEMAYFSAGRILELGCNQGLSTSIMAGARRDAGVMEIIEAVDLEQHLCDTATRNLKKNGLSNFVEVYCDDAVKYCSEGVEAGRTYEFAFIDHSHHYDLVLGVANKLEKLLIPGGFCFFHDYNDKRNIDPNEEDYGVSQAVDLAMGQSGFEFYGIFGCAALFRKAR